MFEKGTGRGGVMDGRDVALLKISSDVRRENMVRKAKLRANMAQLRCTSSLAQPPAGVLSYETIDDCSKTPFGTMSAKLHKTLAPSTP